jgi:hypothetical protein
MLEVYDKEQKEYGKNVPRPKYILGARLPKEPETGEENHKYGFHR